MNGFVASEDVPGLVVGLMVGSSAACLVVGPVLARLMAVGCRIVGGRRHMMA